MPGLPLLSPAGAAAQPRRDRTAARGRDAGSSGRLGPGSRRARASALARQPATVGGDRRRCRRPLPGRGREPRAQPAGGGAPGRLAPPHRARGRRADDDSGRGRPTPRRRWPADDPGPAADADGEDRGLAGGPLPGESLASRTTRERRLDLQLRRRRAGAGRLHAGRVPGSPPGRGRRLPAARLDPRPPRRRALRRRSRAQWQWRRARPHGAGEHAAGPARPPRRVVPHALAVRRHAAGRAPAPSCRGDRGIERPRLGLVGATRRPGPGGQLRARGRQHGASRRAALGLRAALHGHRSPGDDEEVAEPDRRRAAGRRPAPQSHARPRPPLPRRGGRRRTLGERHPRPAGKGRGSPTGPWWPAWR